MNNFSRLAALLAFVSVIAFAPLAFCAESTLLADAKAICFDSRADPDKAIKLAEASGWRVPPGVTEQQEREYEMLMRIKGDELLTIGPGNALPIQLNKGQDKLLMNCRISQLPGPANIQKIVEHYLGTKATSDSTEDSAWGYVEQIDGSRRQLSKFDEQAFWTALNDGKFIAVLAGTIDKGDNVKAAYVEFVSTTKPAR